MAIETIEFNGQTYPKFQSTGFAAQYAFPFAKQVCKGEGFDIGCNRLEWSLPGSIMIDPEVTPGFDAYNLPPITVDYIFSSHCAEHLKNWVEAFDYWTTKIRSGGTLFLYLPHPSQEYWLPWNNRKHIHVFDPEILRKYFIATEKYKNIFISGVDLYNAFSIMAEKI